MAFFVFQCESIITRKHNRTSNNPAGHNTRQCVFVLRWGTYCTGKSFILRGQCQQHRWSVLFWRTILSIFFPLARKYIWKHRIFGVNRTDFPFETTPFHSFYIYLYFLMHCQRVDFVSRSQYMFYMWQLYDDGHVWAKIRHDGLIWTNIVRCDSNRC